jgi:hypothetical protein
LLPWVIRRHIVFYYRHSSRYSSQWIFDFMGYTSRHFADGRQAVSPFELLKVKLFQFFLRHIKPIDHGIKAFNQSADLVLSFVRDPNRKIPFFRLSTWFQPCYPADS